MSREFKMLTFGSAYKKNSSLHHYLGYQRQIPQIRVKTQKRALSAKYTPNYEFIFIIEFLFVLLVHSRQVPAHYFDLIYLSICWQMNTMITKTNLRPFNIDCLHNVPSLNSNTLWNVTSIVLYLSVLDIIQEYFNRIYICTVIRVVTLQFCYFWCSYLINYFGA